MAGTIAFLARFRNCKVSWSLLDMLSVGGPCEFLLAAYYHETVFTVIDSTHSIKSEELDQSSKRIGIRNIG